MHRFLTFLAFSAFLVLAPIAAQAEAFLAGLEDIPLMEGLVSNADEGVIFDTPEGRIAEATASGTIKGQDILEFYRTTLPQLGWMPDSKDRFKREQETLSLYILPSNTNRNTVRFQIKPLGAARK